MMSLVDVATEVVAPAMRVIFKEGEVDAIELRHTTVGGGSVELTIIAQSETFNYLVIQGDAPGHSVQDWSENLRWLLFDFVAESRSAGDRTGTFAEVSSDGCAVVHTFGRARPSTTSRRTDLPRSGHLTTRASRPQ